LNAFQRSPSTFPIPNINWDPPALVFVNGDSLYCPDCADVGRRSQANNIFAVTAWFGSNEGETDSPDHCANGWCQRFLGRTLTADGVEYVKQLAVEDLDLECDPSPDVVQGWLAYYGIELDA
jgi:hypothetical protein